MVPQVQSPSQNKVEGGQTKLGKKQQDDSFDVEGDIKIDQFITLRANLSPDETEIIEDFAPEDFSKLLLKLEEEHSRIHIKLTYLYKERKLLVMVPSNVHEDILGSLNNIVSTFIASINMPKSTFKLIVHMNKAVAYREDGDEDECEGIPDFQLTIRNTAKQVPRGLTFMPKWIGEVSFAASSSETRTHLRNLVSGNPNIDFAFLITIEESPKWDSPTSTDEDAETLRTKPYLEYDDFIQHLPVKKFGRIVVGKVVWASVIKVIFEAYIRRPDGTFTIDPEGQENHYQACGTLYPTINMNDVDRLLHNASEGLKASLASMMETSQADPGAIRRVRQSTARLSSSWDDMIDNFRIGVRTTAHERYRRWYRVAKHQHDPTDAGQRNAGPGSSGHL